MKEFKLNLGSLGYLITELTKLLQDSGKTYRVNIKEYKASRSLNQNAFQHAIYHDVAKYLMANGRGECNWRWVKLMLKNKFLGWEVTEITDVVTGEISHKETIRETSKLDTGEAYHYTTQIIEWAEFIGCGIKIPANCEYRALLDKQNA